IHVSGFDDGATTLIQEPGIVLGVFDESPLPFDVVHDEIAEVGAMFNNSPVYADTIVYVIFFSLKEGDMEGPVEEDGRNSEHGTRGKGIGDNQSPCDRPAPARFLLKWAFIALRGHSP